MPIYADPNSQVGQLPQVARPITSTGSESIVPSFPKHAESTFLKAAVQEGAVPSTDVGAHTVIHANQIWVDRLRLTSIYVSQLSRDVNLADSVHAYRPVSL
jgi:hypothetical protein